MDYQLPHNSPSATLSREFLLAAKVSCLAHKGRWNTKIGNVLASQFVAQLRFRLYLSENLFVLLHTVCLVSFQKDKNGIEEISVCEHGLGIF